MAGRPVMKLDRFLNQTLDFLVENCILFALMVIMTLNHQKEET